MMVRPIEITDALAKSQEVGRLQQNAQLRPEAAQEFQKTIDDKMHRQRLTAPNPVPESDQVVLHTDEREQRRRKPGRAGRQPVKGSRPQAPAPASSGPPASAGEGHIDITI
jgi:hypothetical protein